MGKEQHVMTHPDGGWQVKGAGNSKATVRTNTQSEAIKIARDIAINQNSEIVIYNRLDSFVVLSYNTQHRGLIK